MKVRSAAVGVLTLFALACGDSIKSSADYVEDYQVGTLVVDIFDVTTKQAIWRGYASDALPDHPSASEKATQAAVDMMFSKFPPAPPPAQ